MILYAPISKSNINVAQRTVTGIAQVEDAPDHQGDVVDFKASINAFSNWPGNIREMHAKKAVGKCVDWTSDPITKSIRVKIKISKGAEDTWQKVLDGTLSALSIGGHELASTRQIDKSTGRTYNRITDYVLTELSLVDSPANPKCVITAIHKNRNGSLLGTDVLDTLKGSTMIKKAHVALRSVAKSLGDNDELLVIKKSDIEMGRTDGLVVLKKSAVPGIISKDDASDAGMMSDDDQTNPGDMGGVDLEDHATNMANAHKDLCGMAGIDDHVGHYADATRGDDDQDAALDDNGAGAGEDDMQMGRRTGNVRKNRRSRNSGANIEALVARAVGSQMSVIAKSFDELKASIGGGATPRKDGVAGSPIVKTISDVVGTLPTSASQDADGSNAARYTELAKSHDELSTRAKSIIAKSDMGHRLSPEEDVERVRLGKSLGRIEVEMGDLRRMAAGI